MLSGKGFIQYVIDAKYEQEIQRTELTAMDKVVVLLSKCEQEKLLMDGADIYIFPS